VGRFGIVEINKKTNLIENFSEKPKGDGSWVNGGFFVLKKDIFKFIKDDSTIWEREPMEQLSKNKQLCAFRHNDFWHAMDTMRDKNYLDHLWNSKNSPWKLWDDQ
jgi:glucose-1-phosphate cytidylyltransferase